MPSMHRSVFCFKFSLSKFRINKPNDDRILGPNLRLSQIGVLCDNRLFPRSVLKCSEERKGLLKEMSETFSTIRKIHPFALLFAFGSMYLITHNINSDISLYEKLFFLLVAGSIYAIAIVFEFQRISKEQETNEKVF